MWLGLLYSTCDDAPAGVDDERAMVILYAWWTGDDRPMSVACPVSSAADTARALRDAGGGAMITKPRCDACGTDFDLPLE